MQGTFEQGRQNLHYHAQSPLTQSASTQVRRNFRKWGIAKTTSLVQLAISKNWKSIVETDFKGNNLVEKPINTLPNMSKHNQDELSPILLEGMERAKNQRKENKNGTD